MGTFLCTQAVRVMLTYWLAIWADNKYHFKLEVYAGIYACIIAGAIVFSATRALLFSRVTNLAAETMHKNAVRGIFNSPLSFFEQVCLILIIWCSYVLPMAGIQKGT